MTERWRDRGVLVAGVVGCAVLVAASVITLGAPDPALAGQFLTGSYPTMASAIALCSLICYGCVALTLLVVLIAALQPEAGWWRRGRALRAAALVLVGAVLLGLSLAGRAETGGGICCGGGQQQIQEAASLAR